MTTLAGGDSAPAQPSTPESRAGRSAPSGRDERPLALWRYEHKGPKYYKLGRKVVYSLDELEAWLAASAAI